MEVQLEERTAKLITVVRAEPLSQVVLVRRIGDAVSPGLHQLARVRPVVAGNSVEEVEDGLRVLGRGGLGALQVIEDRRTICGHLRSLAQRQPGQTRLVGQA